MDYFSYLFLLLVVVGLQFLIQITSLVGKSKKEQKSVSKILWIIFLTSIVVDILFP